MPKRSMAPLTFPQAKRNAPSPMSPLPVPLSSLTGVPASNNYWAVYRGKLVRHNNKGAEGRGQFSDFEHFGAPWGFLRDPFCAPWGPLP